MFKYTIITLLATLALAEGKVSHGKNTREEYAPRNLKSSKKKGRKANFKVTVTNLSWDQPMSPFFVAIHSDSAPRLYTFGQPASDALALLAEEGNNADVVSMYDQMDSVLSSASVTDGLLMGGASMSFEVVAPYGYQYISLASMAVNTNDCFVALSGEHLYDGASFVLPGLDSGSEANTESCAHVPGPACQGGGAGGRATENAEGFVHVHRGNQGIADLGPRYDWRNPMLSVYVEEL
ncbi:MAG: hypothetical protein SGBAC_007398 [Bacillariaceae sp.]